jgi:FkbM family methyltransferase
MPGPANLPLYVRALRTIVRSLPRGGYRAMAALAPTSGQFVAPLAAEIGGALFDCDLGDHISREVCFTGFYEPPVTRIFQQHIRAGGMVIDAGANWGYFALVAGAAVGPHGRVIALEPDPRQQARLGRNLELNNFRHVEALASAAADRAGETRLTGYADGDDNQGTSSIVGGNGSKDAFVVPTIALDQLAGASPVDIVKIDVEGAEDLVLDGMRDGLSAHRYRAILLELHPGLLQARGVDPTTCVRLLLDHGYRGWTIDGSARAYRRASAASYAPDPLLRPLDDWRSSAWPHLLWLC